jgi:hypothetical protein
MTKLRSSGLAGLLFLLSAAPTLAHHSFTSEFDANKKVVVSGVLTKLELVNPHSFIHVDVTDPQTGKVTSWLFQSHGPGTLRRMGLTRDAGFVGHHVTVEAYAAKDGSNYAWASKYTFDDGRVIQVYNPEEGQEGK